MDKGKRLREVKGIAKNTYMGVPFCKEEK